MTAYRRPHPGRTAIYRIYDRSDRLLYLGIAVDPSKRIQKHNSTAAWWHLAELQSVEWFDTRAEAERQEMRAVRSEGPLYNSVYADLFSGGAEDAKAAIPTHLEISPCPWAWSAEYRRRAAPMPQPVRYFALRGCVERMTKANAAILARCVRASHPGLADVWDAQAAGVPARWSDHAVVAWAARLGVLDLPDA